MAEASSIMAALITSQNSPSVSRTSGKVMIFRKTPSVALTKPITRAAINADSHPLTWKPGTRWETIQTASALNAQFRRCLIEVPGKRDYRLSFRLAQLMTPRTSQPAGRTIRQLQAFIQQPSLGQCKKEEDRALCVEYPDI